MLSLQPLWTAPQEYGSSGPGAASQGGSMAFWNRHPAPCHHRLHESARPLSPPSVWPGKKAGIWGQSWEPTEEGASPGLCGAQHWIARHLLPTAGRKAQLHPFSWRLTQGGQRLTGLCGQGPQPSERLWERQRAGVNEGCRFRGRNVRRKAWSSP